MKIARKAEFHLGASLCFGSSAQQYCLCHCRTKLTTIIGYIYIAPWIQSHRSNETGYRSKWANFFESSHATSTFASLLRILCRHMHSNVNRHMLADCACQNFKYRGARS